MLFVTEGQAKNAADMVMRGLRARGVPLHVAVLPYMPAAEIKRALRAALRARNPVSASRRTALSKAATLYRDFTGMEPTHVQRVHVKPVKVGVKIGSLDALAYTTRREGKTERYAHEFSKQARPLLGVSDDGRSIVTAGGRFRFTDRGFVDRK